MNYCSNCGAPVGLRIPDGDDRPRFVCDSCHTIHYENPRLVVGCIPQWEDRILLCRRAIEPRLGKWTLPAGFLENGETLREGAKRESYEEARARVRDLVPYTLFNITCVNQVHVFFRSSLVDLEFKPGSESLEVMLFKEEEIPWKELSFHVVRETLLLYFADRSGGAFPFYMGDILPSGEGRVATIVGKGAF